ncbi:MAG: hypothetical protein ACI8S6_005052, partial [Myxococcota bacterium]
MGGLPRRATIIESLRQDTASPLFVVDAGNFAWKSGRITGEALPQQRRKTEAILDAFARDPVDALGVGTGDLVMGVDWLKDAAQQRSLPMTLANLTCDGEQPFPGHQRVERDGVSVGFVGVLSPSRKVEGCTVTDSAEALRREAAAMGPVDLLVAFGHGSDDEDRALAEAVTELDLIVNGHARLTRASPELLPNHTAQLGAGSRGKKLGVAEIVMVRGASGFSSETALTDLADRRTTYARRLESAERNLETDDPAAKRRAERQVTFFTEEMAELDRQAATLEAAGSAPRNRISVELRDLDRRVDDHPEVLAMLEVAKVDIAALEAAVPVSPLVETPYLGSGACSGCHAEIYQQWQQTGHARAYATLQVENRELDRDCYSCHVTGAFDAEGPQQPGQVSPKLHGVGCESCHGAGRDHARAPTQGGMVR